MHKKFSEDNQTFVPRVVTSANRLSQITDLVAYALGDIAIAPEATVKLLVSVNHVFVAHALRDEVRARLGVVSSVGNANQPLFPPKPRVQRRLGQRLQQTDHRHLDPRIHDKAVLQLKRLQRVVIKTDDESRQHIDAVAVDCAHGVKNILARILRLPGFLEARLVGRLDADKYPAEIGIPKKPQQLDIIGKIE